MKRTTACWAINRPLLIVVVALLCLPVFTQSVQACQCREYGTPICAQFGRADAVFVGQVASLKRLKYKPDNTYTYVMADFVVQEAFRGVTGRRVGVGVATNTPCTPKFEKGKRYLVYASLDEAKNQLFTGMCSGTGPAGELSEAVKELRKLAQGQSEESISGRILRFQYEGLAGIKVEATKAGETFTTVTDNYGYFSLPAVRSGSFDVKVFVPFSARLMHYSDNDVYVSATETDSLSTFSYQVTLANSECSYLEIGLIGNDTRAPAPAKPAPKVYR